MFVQSFFTQFQFKASENTVIVKVVVVQTGQPDFYSTLVRALVGAFYTIDLGQVHFSVAREKIQNSKLTNSLALSYKNSIHS